MLRQGAISSILELKQANRNAKQNLYSYDVYVVVV